MGVATRRASLEAIAGARATLRRWGVERNALPPAQLRAGSSPSTGSLKHLAKANMML